MTTLILCTKPDGSNIGRCDARCYEAKGPTCKCICGGMNHGKGLDSAIRNTALNKEIRQTADAAAKLLFPHVQHKLFTGGKR